MTIRPAREDDAAGILAIYSPIVTDTAISFELEPPAEPEMRRRIRNIQASHGWFVAVENEMIAAYAYGSQFRPRQAYAWTAEVTVYVHSGWRQRGLARHLYSELFAHLRVRGFCTAIAVIALPNEPSVRLHETIGFTHAGVLRKVGYKLGRWHDTGWWQMELQPHPETPLS